MKSYNQFSENIDKAAALKQKQQDAVAKHKESGTGTSELSGSRTDTKEHDSDVGAQQQLSARLAAKRKAAKRSAMAASIKSEIQQDSKQDK